MTIKLSAAAQRIVKKKLKQGFVSAEEVISVALQRLDQASLGDFAPGELAALVAEGEESIKKEGTVDGREYFAERRRRRVREAS